MNISHVVAVLAAMPFGYLGLGSVFGEPAFLEVHDLRVVDETVFVERSYNANGTEIADWRVTILGEDQDAPFCQTIAGPEEHQGWSRYYGPDSAERNMHLDIWTGDTGCSSRLTPGRYQMFVTWTPRNGSSPVTAYAEFNVSG